MWRAIEVIEDYWIIQDSKTLDEYVDSCGDNLVFYSQLEAQEKINQINAQEVR